MALWVMVDRGDIGCQRVACDGLCQARLNGCVQARSIDCEDEVGRGALALGLQALDHAFFKVGDVYGDACLGAEGVCQWLDQLWLAIGVDIHFFCERGCGHGEGCNAESKFGQGGHVSLRFC